MKRLFLTTTILTLGAVSATSAYSHEAQTLTSSEFVQLSDAVKMTAVQANLYVGDFQSTARAAYAQHLYRGEGSSLMHSVRFLRD